MRMIQLLVLSILTVVVFVPAYAERAEAKPSSCVMVAQGVTKLKHISCKKAKRVYRKIVKAVAPLWPEVRIPECKRHRSIKVRGWRLTGTPSYGIGTKFKRGRKSFVVGGGGSCW